MTDDTWIVAEDQFDIANNRHYEGLLAIGSGVLQQRASLEEGLHRDPQDREYLRIMGNVTVEQFPEFKSRVGTYLPGVSGPHPTCGDQMINLPALHGLKLYSGGERLEMSRSRIEEYQRWLDLRNGHLHRRFVWQTPTGTRLRVHFERFISAVRRHVMAARCTIEHMDGPAAEVRLLGFLSAEVRTNGYDHFRHVEVTGENEPITLRVETNAGTDVAAAALMTCDRHIPWAIEEERRWIALAGTCQVEPGETVVVDKFAALTSSRHVAGAPLDAARQMAWDAAVTGFAPVSRQSDAAWHQRWEQTDVQIDGDPDSQRALRVSLYHLLRAVPETDARVAIDAKGAAGEAYCGRYFWDTEMFMLPVFLYTRPEVGRTLARFRVSSLPGARRNAARYGYPGARYAWESAPSGDEQCPNWQYADHEVHVTADVAYGLFHAHLCNDDDATFLAECAEVLLEMARYWAERVVWNEARQCFEMLLVMGPDEYTPFSRNNAFTNRLVALALTLTGFVWDKLARVDSAVAADLRERLGARPDEFAHFTHIASHLRMPYDAQRGLVLQADDFFSLEPLDFERYWPDRSRPLGASVSQERIYRSRVLKQADVIQLMALFPHEFDDAQVRRAYDTYAPLTSHDSSLSRAMHALVAARLGDEQEAWRMWQASVGLDLRPPEAAEGIHAACAGANWQVAVFGFAGVRTRMQSEVLHIAPRLPAPWRALRFPLVWDGQPLRISVERERVTVEHRGERGVPALICGEACELAAGKTLGRDL